MDGPSHGSILISITSVFVLLAGFRSKNAVENLGRPLDRIGSISSLELVTCAVGGRNLGGMVIQTTMYNFLLQTNKLALLYLLLVYYLWQLERLIFDFVNYIAAIVS